MRCAVCGRELVEGASYCPACGEPTGVPECEDFTYEAFFSYRHVARDRTVARRLQRLVEGYRVPRELRGAAGRPKLGKCFRDEDELPTSSSLPDMIEDALRHARFLVVICSPQMRESLWVAREVELFASLHGRDRILLVLADGEPADAFPPLLMSRTARDGEKLVEHEVEPVAADLRPAERKRFSDEALRIVAPIIGCGYDDLRQRARARKLRTIAAAACAAAVVTSAFGAFALFQQAQIQANYEAALENQSAYLADQAETLLGQGDRMQAIQVALRALGADGSGERPYVPSARVALEAALQVYPSTYWRPCYSRSSSAGVSDAVVSGSGAWYAVLDSEDVVSVYRVSDGTLASRIEAPGGDGDRYKIVFCGDVLVSSEWGSEEMLAHGYDPATGDLLWETAVDHHVLSLAALREGELVALVDNLRFYNEDDTAPFTILRASDGEKVLDGVEVANPAGGQVDTMWYYGSAAFSEDGALLVMAVGDSLQVADVATGEVTSVLPGLGQVASVRVKDGVVYFSSLREGADASTCCVSAYDLSASQLLWTWETEAKSTFTDLCLPEIVEFPEGGRVLVTVQDRVLMLDASDGSVLLDLDTFGEVSAAHVFDGYRLVYVSDGAIYFARSDEATVDEYGALWVGGGMSSPYIIGGGLETGDASGLEFFTGADGSQLCLLGDARRTVMCAFDVELKLPERLDVGQEDAWLTGSPDARSADGRYAFYMDHESSTLHVLDCASFELAADIDLSPLLASATYESTLCEYMPSGELEDVVYVCVEDTLHAVEVPSGEVLGSYEGFEAWDSPVFCHDGTVTLVARPEYDKRLLLTLDARTLEARSSWDISCIGADGSSHTVSDAGVLGNLLLVVVDDTLWAFDGTTGERVSAELDGLVLAKACGPASAQSRTLESYYFGDGSGYLTFNEGRSRVLVCDVSGRLAQYDSTGALVWEREPGTLLSSEAGFLMYLPDGRIFVQGNPQGGGMGQSFLLDGETGAVLASSNVTSAVGEAWLSADGSKLYARSSSYAMAELDSSFVTGITVINLDPASFGVESEMGLAVLVSTNEDRALFYDQVYKTCFTLPLYSTEELVARAQELVQGHELTGAEELLYHME